MLVLPTMPITELRTKQPKVLDSLKQSPVVLTHRGHSAAVLVSPEQWNAQQVEIRRLHLLLEAKQLKEKGEPTIPLAEIKRRIAAKETAANVGD